MDIQELEFTVMCRMGIAHNRTTDESESRQSAIALGMSKQLDKTSYLNQDHSPNASGAEVMSKVLVSSLVGLIHYAHTEGYMDSATHLRAIIAELEEGFVTQHNIKKGTPDKLKEWNSK